MRLRKFRCKVPMNLQLFAEGSGGGAAGGEGGTGGAPGNTGENQTPPAIDYEKIQQMLEGTLKAKEETAL